MPPPHKHRKTLPPPPLHHPAAAAAAMIYKPQDQNPKTLIFVAATSTTHLQPQDLQPPPLLHHLATAAATSTQDLLPWLSPSIIAGCFFV
jgi:hypothetical protein